MAAGDLVDKDWQVEIRGLLLGPGTPWRVGTLAGWSSRSVRADDTPRASSHGSIPGLDLTNSQTRILRVNTGMGNRHTTADELVALRDDLRAAWATEATDVPIVYQLGGQKRLRFGRTRDLEVVEDDLTVGYMTVDCEFWDRDGVEYSAVEYQVNTPPEEPGAGFTPPFSPPWSLPAGTIGSFDADNAGRVPAPWTARIYGPTNLSDPPYIENIGTGDALVFSANGGLDIPASQWADIDSATRSVTLNGTSDRRMNLATHSRWWSLAPGSNSIRFAGSGTLEFSWRDTW